MLDPQLLRKKLEDTARILKTRNCDLDVARLQTLEERRKVLQVRTEELRNLRNTRSKAIGAAKAAGGGAGALMAEVKELGGELEQCEAQLNGVREEFTAIARQIPNLPHDTVPRGADESDNREERRWGEAARKDFTPVDHAELGAGLGMMDFAAAAALAGARFVVMSGALARLHRALARFMLDLHTGEHGYTEVMTPFIVNNDTLYGTGQLPKFADDQFQLAGERGFYLIPTAEVPLTNLVKDRIVTAAELPMHLVAHTPCFRREAGAHGKDTRGMIRQHQFEKVELVHITRPQDSWDTLELLAGHAEAVLQRLELPYRVVTLCTGDMGFSAAKTYDLEVWLPGQNRYREISSCSNCEAFQARRMRARWRNPDSGPEYLHTLNGSGVAVGRALVAVMENFQNADGTVTVPDALRSYMNGEERIGRG